AKDLRDGSRLGGWTACTRGALRVGRFEPPARRIGAEDSEWAISSGRSGSLRSTGKLWGIHTVSRGSFTLLDFGELTRRPPDTFHKCVDRAPVASGTHSLMPESN